MSFLRKSDSCNSCNVNADTGAISLQVVTSPTQVTELQSKKVLNAQSALASEIQQKYFNGMDLKSCDTHMKTCNSEQCRETKYENTQSLHPMLEVLKNANLTARVSHMDHGIDSQAVCAEVTHKDLAEMLSTGEVQVQGREGVFKLQSTNNDNITNIQYHAYE